VRKYDRVVGVRFQPGGSGSSEDSQPVARIERTLGPEQPAFGADARFVASQIEHIDAPGPLAEDRDDRIRLHRDHRDARPQVQLAGAIETVEQVRALPGPIAARRTARQKTAPRRVVPVLVSDKAAEWTLAIRGFPVFGRDPDGRRRRQLDCFGAVGDRIGVRYVGRLDRLRLHRGDPAIPIIAAVERTHIDAREDRFSQPG
jgi:hypothetical protein